MIHGQRIDLVEANTFASRLKGLLGTQKPPLDGIIIYPCQSIHTFFMNYSIDVFFLTRELRLLKSYRALRPWRHTLFYPNAFYVIETAVNLLPTALKKNDQFEWVKESSNV